MSTEKKKTSLRPWSVLESRITHQDQWLKVRTDRCLTPAGVEVSPYHVLEYPNWINVVALTQKDLQLVLVREYRHGRRQILPGLVGGIVENSDSGSDMTEAEHTARRELKEETGYTTTEPLLRILTGFANPATQSNLVISYLATDVQLTATPRLDEHESIEVYHAPFSETLKSLLDGTLEMQTYHVAALWAAASLIMAQAPALRSAWPLRRELLAALFDTDIPSGPRANAS